ncbi:MAG: type II toxin-antitoxin system HicA family toxin [Anaerolineales bacterium]|nr:type II toxin-antitoxin system HicA family toxin [Anaerolineales bacterium]MDP2777337.1 type II toxin-antitoxin system HicA family toxin [Anaerolineales bacterium]
MDSKHRKTLETIFNKPEPANIAWRDVETLFIALGAEISEGNGSRVRVALKDVRAVFHRPHPRKETNKGAVKSVRRFLEAAGVKP